jgi:hypothetical protein
MRIITYHAADAPERERYLAYIFMPAKTRDGQASEVRLPTWFPGSTKELASARAAAWWTGEQKKRADEAEAQAARDAARKKGRAQ